MTGVMSGMVRLFAAIYLPSEIRQQVSMLQQGIPGVRWVPPGQLHLTLRFIGNVDRERELCIRSRLAGLLPAPMRLCLKQVGVFPDAGPPRVLWTGVEHSEPLMALRDRLEASLIAAGCEPEQRSFSPHITLARLRDVPRARIIPYLGQHERFSAGPFETAEFHLYSSRLSHEGCTHTVEQTYPIPPCDERDSGVPDPDSCS